MTRIDFYLTGDRAANARLLLACRVADRAYRAGHCVYMHADSPDEAGRLDDLLWTFRAGSFVPHALHGDARHTAAPVVIGHDHAVAPACHQVLVNLGTTVPEFFSRFDRVAEVVEAADEARAAARERFRFYRERGYPLQTHEV